MTQEAVVGAYTAFTTKIPKEASKVFDQAMEGFAGVGYTPLAVSTQVVEGTNYRFFCNALGVYPGAVNEGAMVDIHQPLDGQPHIKQVRVVT